MIPISKNHPLYYALKTEYFRHYTRFVEHCQVKEQNLTLYMRGDVMISYEPFYKTLKEKGISTYKLINEYGISRSLLDRLKHDKPISTVTLNDLCNILHCKVEDVIIHTEDVIIHTEDEFVKYKP